MRRLLFVALTGAVLRELLPVLRKLADWMDPCDAPNAWEDRRPLPDERVYVPTAWVEMEAGQ